MKISTGDNVSLAAGYEPRPFLTFKLGFHIQFGPARSNYDEP
jgi:hypothetical protein